MSHHLTRPEGPTHRKNQGIAHKCVHLHNIKEDVEKELKKALRKIKPPTFDGKHKKGEDDEVLLLGMRKYLQLHNYSFSVEARIATYNL